MAGDPFECDHVVFDTSAIHLGKPLTGANAALLSHFVGQYNVAFWLPEVCLRESTTQLQEAVRDAHDSILKGDIRLRDLGIQASLDVPLCDEMVKDATAEFQRRLESLNIKSLPIPSGLGHDPVLDRLQAGRKPFRGGKNREIGYRDALIWESLLSLASGSQAQSVPVVAFVCANSNDFGERQGDEAVLDGTLVREAAEKGLEVILVESVSQFISRVVKPLLEPSDQIRALMSTEAMSEDLRGWLEEQLLAELPGEEPATHGKEPTSMVWRGVNVEDVSISGVGSVVDVDIVEVRQLGDGEFVVDITCEVEALIDFFVYRGDIFILDAEEISALSPWSEHYWWGQQDVVLNVGVEIIASVEDDAVEFVSMSVSSVSDIELEEARPL